MNIPLTTDANPRVRFKGTQIEGTVICPDFTRAYAPTGEEVKYNPHDLFDIGEVELTASPTSFLVVWDGYPVPGIVHLSQFDIIRA